MRALNPLPSPGGRCLRNAALTLVALGIWTLAVAGDAEPGKTPADLARCHELGLAECPQPFDPALPPAHDMLTWDQTSRVIGFRNTYRQYQGDAFHTLGHTAFPLPKADRPLPEVTYHYLGRTYSLADYLQRESVTGLLVIKDGHIAFEHYGAGNTDRTLWTSRSVAKSVVSVLVGVAIREGAIASVNDTLTRYLPELKGTAWDGSTLRDVLQHSSGVLWNENYADPGSDFAKLTHCEAGPQPYECIMTLAKSLQRRPGVQPGELWSYNTMGAWLVGRALEKATGMPLARYLEARIWSRYAMERDGVWQALSRGEIDMGGHGFNATLRDWGRFGLFVANGGRLPSGEELLPQDWIRQSTTWTRATGSVTPATPDGQYGYQWWYLGIEPGLQGTDDVRDSARQTFWAEGIYGQVLAINPTEHLVMVQWSTWPKAEKPDALYDEQALLLNALVRALASHH